MVNTAILVRASLAIHTSQALWSVVVVGVVIANMLAKGPPSSAIKYMFAMIFWFAAFVSVAGHTNGGISDEVGNEMCIVSRWNRVSPFEDPSPAGHDIEETTKDAFSSNDEYALVNKGRDEGDGDSGFPSHYGRNRNVFSYDTGYGAYPGNNVPWDGEGSVYNGIGGHGPAAMGENRRTPSGLSMPITPDEDYSCRERQ